MASRFGRGVGPMLAVVVLISDQLTKHLALGLDPAQPVVVAPFLNLVLVWNRGVSFGMLNTAGQSAPWLLIGLAVAIMGVLVWWLWRERSFPARLALWLVMAGALGNVIDRLRFGAVVDFLDLHAAGWHWPAFNIADSAIVIGAGLLLVDSLLLRRATIDDDRGETDARA